MPDFFQFLIKFSQHEEIFNGGISTHAQENKT
jgi:hypothetical protein